MAKTIVALYDDYGAAEKVVRELENQGFSRDDISLVAHEKGGGTQQAGTTTTQEGSRAGEGAAAGAGTGAVVGGLAGLLVGLGALAIPGIGPIIAAGPIATTLAGAGVGAAAGGIVGALVGIGVPKEEANAYAEGVRRGGTLVMVRSSDDMANQAKNIMNHFQPIDLKGRAADWRQQGWSTFDEQGQPYMDVDKEREMGRGQGVAASASTMGGTGSSTSTGMRDFSIYDIDFRSNYNMVYASQGRDYAYYESAYHYGYDLAEDPSYRGRKWNEIEPDARRDWEANHPDSRWDEFKAAVRHAWERVTSSAQGETRTDVGYTGQDYQSGTGEGRFRDLNNP